MYDLQIFSTVICMNLNLYDPMMKFMIGENHTNSPNYQTVKLHH